MIPPLTDVEARAWKIWQDTHPESKDAKHWHELPWHVQQALIHFLEAE